MFGFIASTVLFAQGAMTVNQVDFVSNPAKFNGKTIKIQNIIVNLNSPTLTSPVAPAPVGVTPMVVGPVSPSAAAPRSEEHTSELQSH